MRHGMGPPVLGLVAAALLVDALVGSAAEGRTTFSGRAFGASVNIPLIGPLTIADTGALSPGGGFRSAALLDTRDLGVPALESLLQAQALVASTSGAEGAATSSASVAHLVVLPGHPAQVTASFVRAESEAACAGFRGSTEIAELTVSGQRIEAPPGGFPPNFTVTAPGGATVIINEQGAVQIGTYRETRVHALRLAVPGIDEIIIASAKSDIDCALVSEPGPCHDFVTGGGWITVSGGRATFGANAGFRAGSPAPTAHLTYRDDAANKRVTATGIDAYEQTGPTRRRFTGPADINAQPGRYTVEVDDQGEPGRRDLVVIELSDGYGAAGTLAGGDVRLHRTCP